MTAPEDLATQAHHTRTTSAGWMIQRLAAEVNQSMKARLAGQGLTLDQFVLMMTLAEGDGITQTEIGAKVRFPGYTVTRALDALSEQGLVERRPDARSRRAHRVVMTAPGQALMQDLFAVVAEVNAGFLAPLDADDRRLFLSLLTRLVEADRSVGMGC